MMLYGMGWLTHGSCHCLQMPPPPRPPQQRGGYMQSQQAQPPTSSAGPALPMGMLSGGRLPPLLQQQPQQPAPQTLQQQLQQLQQQGSGPQPHSVGSDWARAYREQQHKAAEVPA